MMSRILCFLCGKIDEFAVPKFVRIELCKVPSSQKPVATVLQHFANRIKTKLIFQEDASLCCDCLSELVEYDSLMIRLLSFQKKLTRQLEVIITPKSEISEEDIEMIGIEAAEIEEEGDTLEDAFNPELGTKEELVEFDDNGTIDNNSEQLDDDEDDVSDGDTEYLPGRRLANHECVICGSAFKSKQLLQNHITEMHNAKVFSCTICGAVRRDEEYLELHMNIHDGKTENECRYCPKRFARPMNTLRHMRKHWDKKKYQCEKCGERFSLDNMLYNHRLRHEAEENPLICSTCNQSFRSRKTFNHHTLIHKTDRPRHHCSHCSKSFTERYTLKMHLKTHGDMVAGSISDTSQDVQLKETEEAVTMLVESISIDQENSCIICRNAFDNKDLLDDHLQRVHDVILK